MDDDELLGFGDEDEEENEPIQTGVSKGQTRAFDYSLHDGVTVSWLMAAFRMDRPSIRRRLVNLQPLRKGKNNADLYDFIQACNCLADPKIDLSEYFKRMLPKDLPTNLQKDYWDAKLKQQKFEELGGDLWETKKVVECFGKLFILIKTTMALWLDNVKAQSNVSDEQKKILRNCIDGLMAQLYEEIKEMSLRDATLNSLHKDDEEL